MKNGKKKFFGILGVLLLICAVGAGAFFLGHFDAFHFEHNARSTWERDDSGHWHVCEECGEIVDKDDHEWNENVLINDSAYHWYECFDCGQKSGKSLHNWNNKAFVVFFTLFFFRRA